MIRNDSTHHAATTETLKYKPNQDRRPNISGENNSIEGQQRLEEKKSYNLDNKTLWTQRILASAITASGK